MKHLCHATPLVLGVLISLFIHRASLVAQTQPCILPDSLDMTDNDPNFWKADYWWDKVNNQHDLCEMPVDLQVRIDNVCPAFSLQIRYTLLLDLDNDGVTETAIYNGQKQLTNTVWYENALQANYEGGTPYSFDSRPVANPAKDHYRFALQVTSNGNSVTAALRFNTLRDSNTFVLPQIPHGKHRMRWFIREGCGRVKTCEYEFEIKDGKKPVIACKPQLNAYMVSSVTRLYAADILEEVSDNCTPAQELQLSIINRAQASGQFPRDPATRLPLSVVSFTCSDLGPNLIDLWVKDKAGNTNFCTTQLTMNDYNWNCIDPDILAGAIKTTQNQPLLGVIVKLSGTHLVAPPVSAKDTTNPNGLYYFRGITAPFGDYTVCPAFNENPLNGVTTIDLALINQHILGLDTLDSPYKKMAADANNSGTITSFDVVELRKLILGIHEELPNSDSWRFVAKSYVFPDSFPDNIPPCLDIVNKNDMFFGYDFIGVKIGDVNDTATPNLMGNNIDDRSLPEMPFALEDRPLLPGDVFETSFHTENPLLAQQFTLNFPQLELLEIIPAAGINPEDFAHFPPKHQLAHAWNSSQAAGETPSFTLRFRALAAGRLSKLLFLADSPTPSLAYAADRDNPALKPTLHFLPSKESALPQVGEGFILLQNQPNPFSDATVIGFYLPQDDKVYLTIFDEAGRTLLQRETAGTKGYNQIALGREDLSKGPLYYKVETSTASAIKKMTAL